MMGGFAPGGYSMGPGMMWGYGAGGYGGLKLSDEQRTKIASIQEEFSRKQWELMGKMHEQRYQLYEFDSSDKTDESAARKAYQAISDTRKAMFENSLDMRKRIDAVLTKEQREQLRSYWSRG
jgi:Spy/CpxP family protein refolding chaperone